MIPRASHPWRRSPLVAIGIWIAATPSPLAAQEPAAAKVAWKYAPAGARMDDVLAGDEVVFAVDRSGRVHAVDPATGEARWTTAPGLQFGRGFGLALSPAPDFPALLVGDDTGLTAFDVATGARRWHTGIAAGVAGPACTAQVVVAGGADGIVYGCDLATGEIRWRSDYLEDAPDDPPGFVGANARFADMRARPCGAATDGAMVVLTVFDQCRALAFDAATGKRLWAFATRGWTFARPAFGPRNVYVASQDGNVYAVDKQLGKEAWHVATGARNEGACAPTERFVYFGSCDGKLYAVDHGVGRVVWTFTIEPNANGGRPIYSRPLVVGDTICLATMPGVVYALDRRTGALRWQLRPSADSELNSDLVAVGDRLFVTTRKTDAGGESALFAIDPP